MSQELVDRLPELEGKKVLIFGDVGVDEYVDGHVARISPEAPVPVVEVHSTNEKLGLSANVAANVRALGGSPMLFSLVGEDKAAQTLKTLLTNHGLSTDFLMTDPARDTTRKLRVMTGQHHVVRVDYENKAPVSLNFLEQFAGRIENGIQEADCLIIQDYAKGLINKDTCQFIISKAKKHNKPVLVDPYRSTPLSVYSGAHFMTPNRDEAMELAKQIPKPEVWSDVEAIGNEFMQILNAPNMIITMGAEGMKIFDQQSSYQLPTFAKKVFDVTGAGDTVIAAFSLGIGSGWDIKTSGLLANLAAGVVVGQIGAVSCSTEELKDSIKHLD